MVEIFGGESISPGAAKSIRLALTLSQTRSIIVKSLDQLPASAEHDLSQLLEQGGFSLLATPRERVTHMSLRSASALRLTAHLSKI